MNAGSIGEMPPSTRGSVGCSRADRARSPAAPSRAKRVQPRSISKSQCERLFGSFQSITASTTRPVLLARDTPRRRARAPAPRRQMNTSASGMIGDRRSRRCAASPPIAGAVGHPPVRRVARVLLLDEVQPRERRVVEDVAPRRTGSRARRSIALGRPAQHRLEHEQVADHVLVQQIEREQRMPQVIEDAHEQHEVEPLAERGHVVDRQLPELDVGARRPPRRTAPAPGRPASQSMPTTRAAPRRFISSE